MDTNYLQKAKFTSLKNLYVYGIIIVAIYCILCGILCGGSKEQSAVLYL